MGEGATASAERRPEDRRRFSCAAFAGLVVTAWLSFAPALLNDGDTSWHLATGQWILQHRAIPHVDPFSFTHRGTAWTAHEWLVDLLMATAFLLRGWAALVLPFALSAGAAIALAGREVARALPWQRVLVVLALLTATLSPFMLARPHVIAWPLLAIWMHQLLLARERDKAPPLALALLIALWANLHASFIFALFLAGMFGLEALVAASDKKRAVTGWGLFGTLCLACAFVTPHGLQGLLYPFQVSGMRALPLIQEWRPTSFPEDAIFFLFALCVAAAAILVRRRLSLIRFLLLAVLGTLAFMHARHQPLFAIVSVMLLARAASSRSATPVETRTKWLLPAGLLAIAVIRLALPLQRGDSPTYPATALARLPADLRTQPVFNSYSFGGPLILHGIAPFIDGRSDMYGDAHTLFHQSIVEGNLAGLEQAVGRWGIRWTILSPDEPLVRRLDRDPRWRRVYADRNAVVHVRR